MRERFNTRFRLLPDTRAVTALEYGIIAAAVVSIGLAGFSVVGDDLAAKFNLVGGALTDPTSGSATQPAGSGGHQGNRHGGDED